MTDTRGRTLPPPAKPKRRGHEPAPEVATVVDLRSDPPPDVPILQTSRPQSTSPAVVEPKVTKAPQKEPAKAKPTRVTVYSDTTIDDFLAEVRVQAAMRRLDLTDSAVWRWAMAELMERFSAKAVVEHFAAATLEAKVGRPRR